LVASLKLNHVSSAQLRRSVRGFQRRPLRYRAYLDGSKEICQRQTEMEKARRPVFL